MSAPPFMPLYVADYFGDTVHLSADESGAYLHLLMCMWRAGGELPNDPIRLARFCRLSPRRWASVEPAVMAFFRVDEGVITNDRLSRELLKYQEVVSTREKISSAGGKAKSLKYKKAVSAASMPTACQPEPEPEVGNKALTEPYTYRRATPILPREGQSSSPPVMNDQEQQAYAERVMALRAERNAG